MSKIRIKWGFNIFILLILQMGNQICCEETRTHGPLDRVDHDKIKRTVISEPKKQPVATPHEPKELTYAVSQTLKNKRFFEQESQHQAKPSTRRYGGDVYVGAMDENNLKPHGFGRMYKEDHSHFIGHFNHGKAEGRGAYIFADGSYYFGEFHNNRAESIYGEYWSNSVHYRGGFSNNLFEGEGYEEGRGYTFKGHYHNGSRKKGLFVWQDNKHTYSYDGEFNQHNQFHGKGLLKEPEGTYSGDFVEGEKHGDGIYQFAKGSRYVGTYVHGVRQGRGTIYNSDGSLAYTGEIGRGLPHGKGSVPSKQGKLIETEWVEGIEKAQLQL